MKTLPKPMTMNEVVTAVEGKRGPIRIISWKHYETKWGVPTKHIVVTKTMKVLLNRKYSNLAPVKAKREAEEVLMGGPVTHKTSYVHDENHWCIVHDKTTERKDFLQVLVSHKLRDLIWAIDLTTGKKFPASVVSKVKTQYWQDGVEITDPATLRVVKSVVPKKAATKDEDFNTFVLPIDKILEVK
jgi:hypothetical protein